MNRKIKFLTLFFLISLISLPITVVYQLNNISRARGLTSMSKEKIMAKDLLANLKLDENDFAPNEVIAGDGFWGLKNGSIINYNPICIFANDSYWDSLAMYNSHNEYYFEVTYNGTTLFDSTYEYSNYSDFWYDGFEWNVSSFFPNKCLNLSMSFYRYDDPSINHTNSIMIYFETLRTTPTINLNDFIIDFFHFPGTLYESGYYYFFNPDGPNAYFHFAIYSDGYVQLKYQNLELYENKDLTAADIQELVQELTDLGFFQLRNNYYPISYDYYYHSYYDIMVTSDFGNESRSIFEAYDFHLVPEQYYKCLRAIIEKVGYLYYTPLRWNWELFWIVAGSSLGGLGTIVMAVMIFSRVRRR